MLIVLAALIVLIALVMLTALVALAALVMLISRLRPIGGGFMERNSSYSPTPYFQSVVSTDNYPPQFESPIETKKKNGCFGGGLGAMEVLWGHYYLFMLELQQINSGAEY